MRVAVHAVSEVGHLREQNEDMILVVGDFIRDEEYRREIVTDGDPPLFFAVADGLGGASAGEIASEQALRSFRDSVAASGSELRPELLYAFFDDATRKSHDLLVRAGRLNPRLRGMGTTLTGVLYLPSGWFWVNIGDTRVYTVRGGLLAQISRDHTLKELSGRPDIPSNILSNCLGGGADAYCDAGGLPGLSEGNALLLTSDGIHDLLGNRRIGEIISDNPQDPVRPLVQAALDAGGRDNVSCLWIRILDFYPSSSSNSTFVKGKIDKRIGS